MGREDDVEHVVISRGNEWRTNSSCWFVTSCKDLRLDFYHERYSWFVFRVHSSR